MQAPFLLCLAQWVDLGYESPHFIDQLLQQLSVEQRAQLPLRDFLMVRMAEAFAAMAHEDTDRAIDLLTFVLGAERELGSEHLSVPILERRANRKKREYQKASEDIVTARQLAQHLELKKPAAAVQIQEAWLAFQRAEPKEAWSLLDQAEEQLRSTDDDISLGTSAPPAAEFSAVPASAQSWPTMIAQSRFTSATMPITVTSQAPS